MHERQPFQARHLREIRTATPLPPSCSATTPSMSRRRRRPIALVQNGDLSSTDSMLGLLEDWDANFAVLQEIVAFLEKEGLPPDAAKLANLHALPPVRAARQDVLRRAEFPGTRRRDAARRHDAGQRPEIHRREIDLQAVSVSQGAEHAAPAPPTTSPSRAACRRSTGRRRSRSPSAKPASASRPSARSTTSPAS